MGLRKLKHLAMFSQIVNIIKLWKNYTTINLTANGIIFVMLRPSMHVLMIIATNYRRMAFSTVNYVFLLTDGARVALNYRSKSPRAALV